MHGKPSEVKTKNLHLGVNDEGVGIRKSMGSRSTVKDKTSAASAMEANHNVRGKTMAGVGPFPAALIVHGQQRNSGQRTAA